VLGILRRKIMQTTILNSPQGDYESATDSRNAGVLAWAALAGRIGLALIFLWSGYGKIMHLQETAGYMNAYHVPLASVLVWPAAIVELAGAAMLVTGWKARGAALVLAAYSILAALIFHNFWAVPADQALNQTIHFMKNIAIMGGLLQICAFGAGRYAYK
jgi:putative oxidoreductase